MDISIVIPVFNRSNVCLSAVRSVFRQTVDDFELIVVDDGSTFDMGAVKREVEDGGGLYLEVPHRGVSAARNVGARAAQGRWLAFLDSDDTWLPEKLEVQREHHRRHPEILISQTEDVWYRRGERVNPRERHAKPNGEAFTRSLELCCISPSAVMLERKLFEASGGFDELMHVCEDYDLWLRLTTKHQIGLIDLALVEKFGGHADQLSRSEPAIDRFRVYALVKLLQSDLPNLEQRTLAAKTLRKKAKVLLTGAKKRSNRAIISILQEILTISDLAQKDPEPTIWRQFTNAQFLLSRQLLAEQDGWPLDELQRHQG